MTLANGEYSVLVQFELQSAVRAVCAKVICALSQLQGWGAQHQAPISQPIDKQFSYLRPPPRRSLFECTTMPRLQPRSHQHEFTGTKKFVRDSFVGKNRNSHPIRSETELFLHKAIATRTGVHRVLQTNHTRSKFEVN